MDSDESLYRLVGLLLLSSRNATFGQSVLMVVQLTPIFDVNDIGTRSTPSNELHESGSYI
jgi:hypothetical protein